MTVELGSAYGKIVIDASGVQGSVNQANSALDKVGKTAAKMGAAVAGAMAVAGAALGAASVKLVNMGADAGETASLLAVSLGPETDALNNRLRNFADIANRSFYELQEGSATFVAMTRAMGATQEVAADLSGDFVEMATDLGSFFNVATEDALHDLRSALAGASEPMQKYGIDVRETTLKQIALQEGIISTSSEAIPRLERAMLIADIVTRQAADAMGDAERTADSFQNQLRGLQGQVKDAAYEIGIKLIPTGERLLEVFRTILPALKDVAAGIFAIFANLVNVGIDFVKALAQGLGVNFDTLAKDGQTWGQNFVVSLAEGMAAAISAVVNVLTQLGNIIADWLAPGSPPKLLPDLPKWGAAAMTEYMQGWRQGDLSVFDELSGTIEGLIRSMSANIKEKDIIPRILGSRSAIAAAIEQVRETGAIADNMLSLVLNKARLAGNNVREYVAALFDVAAADQAVIRAQEELNRITAEYNAILDPLDKELREVQDRQSDIRDQKELAEVQEKLGDIRLTGLEREELLLRERELMLRQQIRHTESEKDAAVDAAEATLDAAEQEKKERELKLNQLKSLLDIQKEQNSLLGDQKKVLEGLADAAGKAAKAAKGAAGKALKEMAMGAAGGLGGMAGTIATQFDEVFDRVSEKFAPLQSQVEELGRVWARVFNNARNRVDELRKKWEESELKKKLDELDLPLQEIGEFALKAAIGVLILKAAFTIGGWISTAAAGLGAIAGHIEAIFTALEGLPGLLGVIAPGLGLLGISFGLAVIFEDETNKLTEAINNWLDTTPLKRIEDVFDLSSEDVRNIMAGLATQIETIFGLLADKLIAKAEEIWAGIVGWFTNLCHDLVGGSIVVDMVNGIIAEVDRLVADVIASVRQFVTDWLAKFAELRDTLAATWAEIKARVEEVWEAVRAFIEEKILAVQTKVEEIIEAVQLFIETKFLAIKTNVETIWEGVRAFIDEKTNAIKTIIETVMGGIETAIQPVYDLWTNFVDAVQRFWEWIKDKVFKIHVDFPDPPSWFQLNSPEFRGHVAFKRMAKDMKRTVVKPKIVFPKLPDWATPGSPLPIHTAWVDFFNLMNRKSKLLRGLAVQPAVPQTFGVPGSISGVPVSSYSSYITNEGSRPVYIYGDIILDKVKSGEDLIEKLLELG